MYLYIHQIHFNVLCPIKQYLKQNKVLNDINIRRHFKHDG